MTTGGPNVPLLIDKLRGLVDRGPIRLEEFIVWQSGVYALLNCVFSAQARYVEVVLPMLRTRLAKRPGLADVADLTFSAFLKDVDCFGPAKFARYGAEVLTRNVLAGRSKVEVCYESALFFARLGLERRRELQALPSPLLEHLVLSDLRREVRGIGPALGKYLLMLFGQEDHIKPDVMLIRFFRGLTSWVPRIGHQGDAEIVRAVITRVAGGLGTTPARLDHAIWQYQSRQGRGVRADGARCLSRGPGPPTAGNRESSATASPTALPSSESSSG